MLKWLWLSLAIVVVDQATKWAAEAWLVLHQPVPVLPSFNLFLAYNTGAAFSFLAGAGGWQRWFFLLLAGGISVALVVWLKRLQVHETRLAVALALVLGGALGNLIDRAFYGHVIDFIDLYLGDWHWPAFNVADIGISCGAVLLALDSFMPKGAGREAARKD